MRFPRFTDSRWFGPIAIVALVAGIGFLVVGCTATAEKSGVGVEFGEAMVTASEAVAQAGTAVSQNSGGNPFTSLVGSILTIVGTIGTGLFGAKKIATKVANEKVATYDAASDNMAFAKDGSQIPVAPVPPKA